MPLSWNEIKDRALVFSREWKTAASEDADAQSFWNEFFEVFGVKRRRVANFEKRVKKIDGRDGYIDMLWKGNLLVEHKSRGKDLDRAHAQARDYFPGLADEELPRYILVSDFARFRLYDLDESATHDFALNELHKKVHLFGFIAGYRKQAVREQDPINVRAVQKMGLLHDALKRDRYEGHRLELFLVRLMFCLFADDTGIFQPKDTFFDLIQNFTGEDGANLGGVLDRLFHTLATPTAERQKSLPEQFAQFPYVDGKLFEESLQGPSFNRAMRDLLLELCSMSWGAISPAVFGAMFQKVIDLDERDRRRQLGAHYTSEENILKLIGPLFLDDLRAELERCKGNVNKLFEFQKKLGRLLFLDPACGCGNFLVITYRELRKLEIELLRAAERFGQRLGSVFQSLKVDVDQFYGIEIEEFPAQVAQVAMWLTDHQMNIEASEVFGEPVLRIPLQKSANIRLGNALRIDWADFVPPTRLNYILGNPPFVGAKLMNAQQREDMATVTAGIRNAGLLDYCCGWYVKASEYLTADPRGFGGLASRTSRDRAAHRDVRFGAGEPVVGDMFAEAETLETRARRSVKCAFVSTNSITQGEQVGVLWSWLLAQGVKIYFAHRTFQWMNDAPGKAAVHCVIIGFGVADIATKRLFEYADIRGAPHEIVAHNINPYLVDAANVLLSNRQRPICDVPEIGIGNKPIDDGNYLFRPDEMRGFVRLEPASKKYFRRWLGADEFINNSERWCLWLGDCSPSELKAMPEAKKRVEAVRKFRLSSKSEPTRRLAATPTRFHVENIPNAPFLLFPRHSSETRQFVPLGLVHTRALAGDACLIGPCGETWHVGVLLSTMHNAWVRSVCGRLKSDFRYSAGIVYNNFPWPAKPSDKHRIAIESAAQAVLDARDAEFKRDPKTSLAVLYDPDTMPPSLVKAHRDLDRAVDAAYVPDGGKRSWASDAERVAFLFTLYQKYTSLLSGSVGPEAAGSPPRH